jgi:hypothetical protein
MYKIAQLDLKVALNQITDAIRHEKSSEIPDRDLISDLEDIQTRLNFYIHPVIKTSKPKKQEGGLL